MEFINFENSDSRTLESGGKTWCSMIDKYLTIIKRHFLGEYFFVRTSKKIVE